MIISALVYEGESLYLPKVTRNEMGTYLCIASNGIPPAVSQRVQLTVNCEYLPTYLSDYSALVEK